MVFEYQNNFLHLFQKSNWSNGKWLTLKVSRVEDNALYKSTAFNKDPVIPRWFHQDLKLDSSKISANTTKVKPIL